VTRSTLPGDDRTYAEAVQENFEDIIRQHWRGEIDWRGIDSLQVAGYLEHWTGIGGFAHIAEALWRYYEWANP
jgi:hypothetical protein